jgi:hypothetical protein
VKERRVQIKGDTEIKPSVTKKMFSGTFATDQKENSLVDLLSIASQTVVGII